MNKHKEEKPEEENEEKSKIGTEKLPFCSSAPSPEHSRAQEDDEPCDDGRAGDVDENE